MISVLITNYNKANFLYKTINSIKKNNFKDFEIIVFDDFSKDNSLNILKTFKNIKIIKNKKKKFKYPALNQIHGILECFKISNGKIICLLDADDYFYKNKLMIVNKYFKKENIDCIFNLPKSSKKQFSLKNKSQNYSIWSTIFPTSCISFKRVFFKKFINFIKEKDYPNLEIDARISIFSKFFDNQYKIINKKLTFYETDPNSITAKISKFSKLWWIRRYQAFQYLKFILEKSNKKFIPSFDYYFTNIIVFVFKKGL